MIKCFSSLSFFLLFCLHVLLELLKIQNRAAEFTSYCYSPMPLKKKLSPCHLGSAGGYGGIFKVFDFSIYVVATSLLLCLALFPVVSVVVKSSKVGFIVNFFTKN